MADPKFLVHDIRAVVTEKSPATTTLRPTVATETDATVTNPAQAVDGSLSSYAELSDATTAVLTVSQFANTRLVSDAGRDWVELSIVGDWANTPDAGDDVQVDYRETGTAGWTLLDNAAGGAEWDGSARTWTITTEAGSNPEAGWEVRLTYTRNAGAGTFRVYDVRAELGGDVVAPTLAEIQEDVDALALAKFETWWATLTAAVEAALETYGATESERVAVLNEVRDRAAAADAYATLTTSAARASAEAYEDLAVGLGFPRYTGS